MLISLDSFNYFHYIYKYTSISWIGILDEVANLRVTFKSEVMATFTWDSPYTLMGVPILGYNVSIVFTSLKSSDLIQSNSQVTLNKEIVLTDPFQNGFCLLINFTTSAINMAGEGNLKSVSTHFEESKYHYALAKSHK